MILSDADAIRAGWPNLASYRHAMRVAAVREAEQATSREQAEHMALRRQQQVAGGAGTVFSTPDYDPKSHVAQSLRRERMLNQMP